MRDVFCCDDFASDAEDVRRAVIEGGFKTEIGPDGAEYTGISLYPVPTWHEHLAKAVGKPIIPKMSFFRLNLAGELPHSWVHSDDICAKYASILYLNPPKQCSGGTAFWGHRGLRIDRMPTKEQLGGGAYADWFYRMMEREWKDLAFWEQVGFAEMKWNRFVTYPTSLFHSRFPFEGFGSGALDGRLIWVCFYDIEEQA